MSGNFIERPRYTCSLGGAAVTANALPDCVPILHAPSGCAGNFAWAQSGGAGLQVPGRCGCLSIPSSNLQESEVVFGGVDRLQEQIQNTLHVVSGGLFAVLTSCVTEIIGDDVDAVVRQFREAGTPIIWAASGGFKGNSYRGYDLVLESLFRHFVAPAAEKRPDLVNLWGIVPQFDPFWRGNIAGVRNLLEALGLAVNSFFTTEDTLEGIRNAARASLNIVVSDLYGQGAARVFEEVHGTPSLSVPLPIGPAASDSFLHSVGQALGLDAGRVEAVVGQENRRYYQSLAPLTDCYVDFDMQRYAVVVGDANTSLAVTRFLAEDLGWITTLAVCTDQLLDPEKDRLAKRFAATVPGDIPFVFETDAGQIQTHWRSRYPSGNGKKYHNAPSPLFVIGSSLDRELAKSLGAAHLSVSFPVANRAIITQGYTGYRGGLRLIEDLLGVLVAGR